MRALGARVAAGAFLLCLGAAATACTSTEEAAPVGIELNRPVHTAPARAWRLVESDTTLGYVVLFADPVDAGRVDHQFFSVRNPWQQELGSVDRLGRAWRFVPHSSEPEWLLTGTLLAGACAILTAPPGARLEEIPLAALGAQVSSEQR